MDHCPNCGYPDAAAAQARDEALVEPYRDAHAALTCALFELMENSEGVAGLHLNGDLAPWDSLITGEFHQWLGCLEEAKRQADEWRRLRLAEGRRVGLEAALERAIENASAPIPLSRHEIAEIAREALRAGKETK